MNSSTRRFHTQSAALTKAGYWVPPLIAALFFTAVYLFVTSLFPNLSGNETLDSAPDGKLEWVYLANVALFGSLSLLSIWIYGGSYRTFDLSAEQLVIRRWARRKPLFVYRPEDVVSFHWQERRGSKQKEMPHLLMETRDGRVQRFLWEMEDFEDLVTELQRWSGKPVSQAERVRGRGNQSLYGENQLGVG